MDIQKGQRLPLIGFLQKNAQSFQIELSIVGVSVSFTTNSATFLCDLNKLPASGIPSAKMIW